MPQPKSALEELLAAASAELPECDCNTSWHTQACAHYTAMIARIYARYDLEALVPDMATELIAVVAVLEEAKHFADHHSNLTGAASLFAGAGSALARLAKLGGRNG